jgi:hypothetical protein
MDRVKMRGSGFETTADRRKGAAVVVACGLKEKRLPHQVRQSLFSPPQTAAARHTAANATIVRTSCRGSSVSCAPNGKGELLSTEEIAGRVIAAKGFDTADAILRAAIRELVGSTVSA